MLKKALLILFLAGGFAYLLVFQPWKKRSNREVSIIDRLPIGSVIGNSNLLDFSDELSKIFFYYQLPFRDVVSSNIILSQSKKYGIDVQSPVYFFANDSLLTINEWGVVATVQDSSKLFDGINQLRKYTTIDDTLIANQKVYHAKEFNVFICYGKDWMLAYHGDSEGVIIPRVSRPKKNEVHHRWKTFLTKRLLKTTNFSAEIESPILTEYGVSSGLISLENDSTNFIFNTELIHKDTLAFQLKNEGWAFQSEEFTKQLVNVHFDIEQLKNNKNHPYRKILSKIGGKISFPVDDFLNLWTGDLAFRRGGIQLIEQQYIETEYDDDFNPTEVVKTKEVPITQFSFYFSTQQTGRPFISKIKKKGIITEEGKKNRLLYSPPFKIRSNDSSMVFYTGKYTPKMELENDSYSIWSINYTPVEFYIDSTATKSIFGRINVPLRKLLKDAKLTF